MNYKREFEMLSKEQVKKRLGEIKQMLLEDYFINSKWDDNEYKERIVVFYMLYDNYLGAEDKIEWL